MWCWVRRGWVVLKWLQCLTLTWVGVRVGLWQLIGVIYQHRICHKRKVSTLLVKRGNPAHFLSKEESQHTSCQKRKASTLFFKRGKSAHFLSKEESQHTHSNDCQQNVFKPEESFIITWCLLDHHANKQVLLWCSPDQWLVLLLHTSFLVNLSKHLARYSLGSHHYPVWCPLRFFSAFPHFLLLLLILPLGVAGLLPLAGLPGHEDLGDMLYEMKNPSLIEKA